MGIGNLISLLLVVLCVVVVSVMLYFKVKGNLFAVVSELIAVAETTGLTGVEKMDKVVVALYEMVPTAFRSILTLERLESIAQYVFDWMRKYADTYRKKLDSMAPGEEITEEDTDALNTEFLASIIADLLGMTLANLREEAHAYGVNSDGLTTKHDFLKAIVSALLTGASKSE